jgi:putative membrane protein
MIWPAPSFIALTIVSLGTLVVYLRGWRKLRASPGGSVPLGRAVSFIIGVLLVWVATCSPLAILDDELLTAHMGQHLLLMTVAPFLILLGTPKLPLLHGLPVGLVRSLIGPISRTRLAHYLSGLWGKLVFCWTFSIGVLVIWHIPVVFDAALKSEAWHVLEHSSFLLAGFLFWWPVIPSSPSGREWPSWSLVLYLFLATLPCDILSGFLVFSDRVVYSVYLSQHRSWAWSILDDQQCAGALMWTTTTILYLIPAAVLTIRLLGVKHPSSDDMVGSELN